MDTPPGTPTRGAPSTPAASSPASVAMSSATPSRASVIAHSPASSAAQTPERLQASIPLVMEAVATLQTMQEENDSLRMQLSQLSAGEGDSVLRKPSHVLGSSSSSSSSNNNRRRVAGDADYLLGAIGAQELLLREREVDCAELRESTRASAPWSGDDGIVSRLRELEIQRARHVQSERMALQEVKKLMVDAMGHRFPGLNPLEPRPVT
jgi:hypothetical protein